MSKKFQKKVENFTCTNCNQEIQGNGYTNHCQHCLWSKHVDVNPGDRASTCGGMMEPATIVVKVDKCVVTHRCQKCGFVRKQKTSVHDNFDRLIELTVSQERTGYGVHGFQPHCDPDLPGEDEDDGYGELQRLAG